YLNLRTLKVEREMTLNTDYFILAQGPPTDVNKASEAEDEKGNSRSKVNEAMEAMRKDAIAKGITVIPLNKFAIMTGYRMPRATRASLEEGTSSDYYGPPSPAAKEEEKPKEGKEKAPKLGEEKPDMKKDDKGDKEDKGDEKKDDKKEEKPKKDKKKK